MTGRLQGRLALVTGASRGIGRAVAERFAREGAHVIALARTTGALEELDDAIQAAGFEAATLVPVDLTDLEKIDLVAASIHQRFGRLDVLASVAGQLGALSPAAHLDPKHWSKTLALDLDVNHRLIRAFDPLLRQSEAGRALFTTCLRGRAPKAYWGLPAAAKAGLEALVRCYAEELARTSLRANLVDPGPCATRLRRQAFPGEPEDAQLSPDDPAVTDLYVTLAEAACTRNGELLARD
ncbi:MAG: SDR family NAD(P)-dependent oxidoreductase [Alphaproteobacteria bacterium]|nr:SDR family NAD(P)-dependent oxidoreductase [Alphaproteobacteria bacterium]